MALQRSAGNAAVGAVLAVQRRPGTDTQMQRLIEAIGRAKAKWIAAHPVEEVSAFLGVTPQVLASYKEMPLKAFKQAFPVPPVAADVPASAPESTSPDAASTAVTEPPSPTSASAVPSETATAPPAPITAPAADPVKHGKATNSEGRWCVIDSERGKIYFTDESLATARLSPGIDVTYTVKTINKYLSKAVLVTAAPRAEATSIGVVLQEQRQRRTDAVRRGGLVKPNEIELRGRAKESGARKHYGDAEAVARNDAEVRALLNEKLSTLYVSQVEPLKDTFKIDLGGLNSIVGEIVYRDETKQAVLSAAVFHVGPSL